MIVLQVINKFHVLEHLLHKITFNRIPTSMYSFMSTILPFADALRFRYLFALNYKPRNSFLDTNKSMITLIEN